MLNFSVRKKARRLLSSFFPVVAAATVSISGAPVFAAPPADPVEAKVDNLLSQMSLDEKISMMSGTQDEMHVPGIPRLKIPELKFSDGPVGVRVWGRATAYPAGAMLAATWDGTAAKEMGVALGRDCRARGVHVLLGPGVDLYRVPQNGRNFEYFGEDPYLSAAITSAWIKGLQGEGVACSVKHYAANDQEILRDSVDTIVDERRLQEICFPPFKAAVVDANAWTVMAAYNKVNGYWCTANRYLLTDVLRNQWGFKGVLMSDWGAVHECLGPLTAGTDLEMGKTVWYTKENIKKYLADGKVSQAQIDDHVKRILRMTVAMGFMDHDQTDKSISLNDPAGSAAALKVAREGLVLLKNDANTLPLDRNRVQSIVVLGPNACPAVTGGGGSSETQPFTSVSLLDAITSGAGANVKVNYIPTWIGPNPTASSAFTTKGPFEFITEDGLRGLRGQYFSNPDLSGTPEVTQTDKEINFNWSPWWKPADKITTSTYSARWTGKIKAPQTDSYIFSCSTDGARVLIDGKPLFDTWSSEGLKNSTQIIEMQRGETHDIVIEYHHVKGNSTMQFAWAKANQEFTPEEARQITGADAVIAAVGFCPSLECEGSDRSYDLPTEQVDLIHSVSRLNPHTVVVLNAGGNVAMDSWIDNVAGLVHAWYPGQNGNTAVAEALFGDINPSGRLTDTFERKFQDSPAYGNYPGDSAKGGTVKYGEGIYVGYRWYDKKNIAPRYPFGYGLSYTTFAINNMKVARDGKEVQVSTDVTNTGKRAGTEVVQLYVRPLGSTIDRPVQELKSFARVELQPNEAKTVTFKLGPDSFATYDEKKHMWISPDGQYELAAGSSSRNIHCSQTVSWGSIEKAANAK